MLNVTGLSDLVAELSAMPVRLEEASKGGLRGGAFLCETEARRLLTQRAHPRGTPTPSVAPQPPAEISGALRGSVKADREPTTKGLGQWSIRITSGLVYSAVQEHGGTVGRGSRLPPRPYLSVALRNRSAAMIELMIRAWAQALKS